MSRWICIDDICIPSDENDWEELVAFADAIAEYEPIEIIRCRECKYCSKDRIRWSEKDKDGEWIDTKCNLCRRTKLEVNLDDFCSYGERISDETD